MEGSTCKKSPIMIFSKVLALLIQSKATLLHHLVTTRIALQTIDLIKILPLYSSLIFH